MPRPDRRNRTWLRSLVAGVAVSGIVFGAATALAPGAFADDSSAVTVTARDQDRDLATAPFPELKMTVSQTKNLLQQAITVSWEGGKRSTLPNSQSGGENFLQLMQCWGDAEGGGPDRTTCQYGGFNSAGARRTQTASFGTKPAPEDVAFSSGPSVTDFSFTGIPFRSVTGKRLDVVQDGKFVRLADDGTRLLEEADRTYTKVGADGTYLGSIDPAKMPKGWTPPPRVDLNNNEFFTQYTTNEVPWAGSGADGRGKITFETQSAVGSYGLGCGAVPEGETKGRSCWLVVVPRGEGNNVESGLAWDQWKHRLAVRLDFQPVGQRCAIGAAERQLAGSELPADAVGSWQPSLCSIDGGSAYTLLTTSDAEATVQANTVPGAPLALTSSALDTSGGATDGLTYAPVALTSIAVAFAIDRAPLSTASEAARARAREPFGAMKLTPRLLAKLMTSSYLDALPTDADRSHLGANPRNLLKDKDFLAVNADNPEWAEQAIVGAVADIMVPQGRSDSLRAVWDYIVADREAREFLAGQPDPYGMTVNPYAATEGEKNPTGAALELPRSDAPKVDPTEVYPATPKALNSITWRPFTNDLASGAYYALRGDGLTIGEFREDTVPAKWTRAPRNLVGDRAVIALTDGSAASRYETVTASLRNPAGQFVTPTTDGMLAAAAAMTTSTAQPQVVSYDPASDRAAGATTAYPLTMPVYAATSASLGSPDVRASYADFIRFASTDGQAPGAQQGQLPEGFAPLPESWRQQALQAANTIEYASSEAPVSTAPSSSGNSTGGAVRTPTAAGQAASVAQPPAAANPAASGSAAGALSGGKTADDPELPAAVSVPISLAAGALAAAAVPFIGRLRRPDDL